MVTSTAGLKKIGEGREAEMFTWEGDRVLRLYRGEFRRDYPEHQARMLDIVAGCGIRVPATYGLVEVDGRVGLIIERLDGPDLLTEVGTKPWHLPYVGGVWGRFHAMINSKQAPLELPSARSAYHNRIAASPLVPDDVRAAALDRLASLQDGDRLNHGDFHPGNIMRCDGDFAAIDWSNTFRGPAEADYVRSYLLSTLGDMPPGSSWLLRTFARVGRRLIRGFYSRAYRHTLKLDDRLVEAWQLPVIAGRLAEGIEVERPALLRMVRGLINDTARA